MVNKSSSSHTDNDFGNDLKNDFLFLGEGDTFGMVTLLIEALVHQKKTLY